jgi:hypothetical protein
MQAGHRSPARPQVQLQQGIYLPFSAVLFLQNILFSVVYLGSLIYVP